MKKINLKAVRNVAGNHVLTIFTLGTVASAFLGTGYLIVYLASYYFGWQYTRELEKLKAEKVLEKKLEEELDNSW